MSRYFFHLHECGTIVRDEAGVERDNDEDARSAAVRAAREVMCAEMSEGRLCLACYIQVADESGAVLMTVRFRDAVTITGL